MSAHVTGTDPRTPAAERLLPEHPLMGALRRGLPISLLVDLVDPNGPRSAEMLEREGISADDGARPQRARAHARTA